jgi:hypothetical protein
MKQRVYRTAAELFGVVDTGVKVYLCPKFLDDFAEELRKRAAAAPTKEKAAQEAAAKESDQ